MLSHAQEHESLLNGHNGAALRVALVYLYTGVVLFLAMGLLGLSMRLAHADILAMNPVWYYRIMTLHSAGMIAGVLLASMGGVVAVLSARLSLSPRLLWIAYVIYFLGVGYCAIAVLLGGFAAGWTVLYPLPLYYNSGWKAWSAFAFFLGYLFVALGFGLWSLAVIAATTRAHGSLGRAMGWQLLLSPRSAPKEGLPPLQDIAATVISIDGLVTVVAGAIALVPMFGQNLGLMRGVNVLFEKNFIYLFGHTVVNMNIYLAAAIVYATLPAYVDRHWSTSWLSTFAINLLLIFMFLPYFHHLYQDFAQPDALPVLGIIGSYGGALASLLVTIFGGMYMIYRSGMRWRAPTILMLLGLWGWAFGGIGGIIDSSTPLNRYFHNTLWVPAHFHTYYLLGAVAITWGFLYHLLAELTGRAESALTRIACWLFGIGGVGFVLMFFTAGAAGMPRRYGVPIPATGEVADAAVASAFVVVLGAGFLWMLYEWAAGLGPAWRRTRTELPVAGLAPGDD